MMAPVPQPHHRQVHHQDAKLPKSIRLVGVSVVGAEKFVALLKSRPLPTGSRASAPRAGPAGRSACGGSAKLPQALRFAQLGADLELRSDTWCQLSRPPSVRGNSAVKRTRLAAGAVAGKSGCSLVPRRLGSARSRRVGVRVTAALLVWLAQLTTPPCGWPQGSESTRDSGEGGVGGSSGRSPGEPAGSLASMGTRKLRSTSEPTGLSFPGRSGGPAPQFSRSFPTRRGKDHPHENCALTAGLFSRRAREGQGRATQVTSDGWELEKQARHLDHLHRARSSNYAGSTITCFDTPTWDVVSRWMNGSLRSHSYGSAGKPYSPGTRIFQRHLPHPGRAPITGPRGLGKLPFSGKKKKNRPPKA